MKPHPNSVIPRKTGVLVVGAGITGCAAAHKLQSDGISYTLIERNVCPGGLSRSISLGDGHFDYTGHFLHLQHYATPSDIPFAGLNDADWQRVERKSQVYLDGRFVPAPFQYNLFYLPEEVRQAAIQSFRSRPRSLSPRSFRDYLTSGFGDEMCRLFLFPYNEKIQAVDLAELSVDAVKRFFPLPDEDRIESGYAAPGADNASGAEYNSRFWYPKANGIGLLADGLSAGLDGLQTASALEAVHLSARRVLTRRGAVDYASMVNTMPLKEFCLLTDDPELHDLAHGLSHNRVISINLLVEGEPHGDLAETHWVYIPERKYPFYRVGFYSNVAPMGIRKGWSSLYVEVADGPASLSGCLVNVINNALDALDHLGWVRAERVTVMAANWIDCAYVHFLHDRGDRVARILCKLKAYGVTSVGRYGGWDYIGMEDSIRQGIEAASEVIFS